MRNRICRWLRPNTSKLIIKVKLKKHSYHIKVQLRSPGADLDIGSSFIIKAVSVDQDQALQIADILYPTFEVQNVEIENSL